MRTFLPYQLALVFFLIGKDLGASERRNAENPAYQISIPDVRYLNSEVIAIPFSRVGNLILVKAKADSTAGSFILDTGCPQLVLNATYFRNYPVEEGEVERNGATSDRFPARRSRVSDFSIGTHHFYQLQTDLADLGAIENLRGVKVLGLIGVQIWKKFNLLIDFENNEIYLQRITRKTESDPWTCFGQDSTGSVDIPFRLLDDRIILFSQVGGKKLRFVIDSGAESNLLDSRLPARVFDEVKITGRTVLVGVSGQKIDVLRGEFQSLKIGNQDLGALPVLVTNLENTCFSHNGCVDGVLGFNILSLRKIGFNFVTNTMTSWK